MTKNRSGSKSTATGDLLLRQKGRGGPPLEEMAPSDKRVALVTGASTGIGREEAIELAKAGYNVVIKLIYTNYKNKNSVKNVQ